MWRTIVMILGVAATAVAQPSAPLEQTLARTRHPDWRERAAAAHALLTAIERDAAVTGLAEVQEAVIDLLTYENALIDVGYRTGNPLSESHRDYYYTDLAPLSMRMAADTDAERRPRLLAAFVNSAYNPDSEFARFLARFGEELRPHVLRLAGSDLAHLRFNAYWLLGELVRSSRAGESQAPLSPGAIAEVRARLREALADPVAGARRIAIGAVVAAEDHDAVPILALLAQTDPDDGQGRLGAYSVRSVAAEAVKTLRATRR